MPIFPLFRSIAFISLLSLSASTPLQARETRLALCGTTFMEPLGAALQNAGLSYIEIAPDVLPSTPPGDLDALFVAYDVPDSTNEAWFAAFVDQGGRLFTFYTLPPPLQSLLHIAQGDYSAPSYAGQFASIRPTGAVPHMPPAMAQNSWNIYASQAIDSRVEVAATWFDKNDRDTGLPALLVGPWGAHLTHVLLGQDLAAAAELYTAVLGRYFPTIWDQARRRTIEQIETIGGGPTQLHQQAQGRKKARSTLKELAESQRQLEQHQAAGDPAAAWRETRQIRQLTIAAHAQTQDSRAGEFRGVWIHQPQGLADWGWQRSCRYLADHGFNALVVNMLDAGRADYPSRVLPTADGTQDHLADAVQAAHKAGLEAHIWKVNYNLNTADSAFVAQLRREGRLQQTPQGGEIPWLCPSHPDNQALEVASLLEVVRRYPVDGIHLDYIRYPHAQGCYDQGCRQRFEEQTGHLVDRWPADVLNGPLTEPFQHWRQAQITHLVQAISLQARALRADIRLSAAVFADWPRTRYTLGQDWVHWAEQGYLDFVCPMDYIPERERFESTVSNQVDWLGGRIPLYIGIGAYRLPGPEALIDQIAWTRRAGADGFILFQYDMALATQAMPLLAAGLTREATRSPHRGPVLWSEVRVGGTQYGPQTYYPAGRRLPLELQLVADVRTPLGRGEASLRTLSGALEHPLGKLDTRKKAGLESSLILSPGDYRPVVEGRYRDGRGKEHDFVRRGPLIRVRGAAFLDSLRRRYGPPEVPPDGIPVAVFSQGHGSAPLLNRLLQRPGLAVFPLHDLHPANLAVAQVLILPQPLASYRLTRSVQKTLQNWLQAGGRLLVTHDMVGFRNLPALAPRVCRGGTAAVQSRFWQATGAHPALASIPTGLQRHAYYDHIVLEAGPEGRVLATDEADRPVLVAGPYGAGHYMALGLVPGLGEDNQAVELSGPEGLLIDSLVDWLARQPAIQGK